MIHITKMSSLNVSANYADNADHIDIFIMTKHYISKKK